MTARLPRVGDPQTDRNLRRLAGETGDLRSELEEVKSEGVPPSGKAGGVLKGSYPDPEFATDMATQTELENGLEAKQDKATAATDAELQSEKTEREAADKAEKEAREGKDGELSGSINERTKGPGSSTESDIAVFSGATGKVLKDGGKTVAQVLDRANHTGTQKASTVSDFDTQVRTSRLDQMAPPAADLTIEEHRLKEVLDPEDPLDAANKAYVDLVTQASAAGLSFKQPVTYATTAPLAGLATATATTLEGVLPLTFDGVSSMPVGTRLFVKDQVDESQNGVYTLEVAEGFGMEGTFGGGGTFGAGSNYKLTRSSDADNGEEVQQGMFVIVTDGTTLKRTSWILVTANPIVVGTTPLEFAPFTATPTGPAGGGLTGTYPNPGTLFGV